MSSIGDEFYVLLQSIVKENSRNKLYLYKTELA